MLEISYKDNRYKYLNKIIEINLFIIEGAQIINIDMIFKYKTDLVFDCSQIGDNVTFYKYKKNGISFTPMINMNSSGYLNTKNKLTIKSSSIIFL